MLDNLQAQKRAQEELDAVLGPLKTPDGAPGQLPDLSYELRLPFVTAIVRESLRWMPVTPLVRLLLTFLATYQKYGLRNPRILGDPACVH